MRSLSRFAAQPVRRRLLLAKNFLRGEVLGECKERAIKCLSSDAPLEPGERIDHHLGIALLAVARYQGVQQLIDQRHRVQRAGMNGALRMTLHVALLVHLLGKAAAGGNIGKQHITVPREQLFFKTIALASFARNVELVSEETIHTPIRAEPREMGL